MRAKAEHAWDTPTLGIPEAPTTGFEPRVWNLLVGISMAAGCGTRSLPGADAETETSSSSGPNVVETGSTEGETSTTAATNTSAQPDCADFYDCPSYYFCIDGECVLPECFHNYDCPLFELCDGEEYGGNCDPVGIPPPVCDDVLLGIPTVIDPGASPLALSFADIDADGRDELVVATQTALLVYEYGNISPTSTPRDVPSDMVQAMTAGHFDDQPGEDLLLLVDAEYHRYFADGIAGFQNPVVEPSPFIYPSGLLAGDFDGQAPSDLLVWGADGAALVLGDVLVPLDDQSIISAAAFEWSSPHAGLVVNADGHLYSFDLAGNHVGDDQVWVSGSMAAVATLDEARYVGVRAFDTWPASWSDLPLIHPLTASEVDHLVIPDEPELVAGDLDGDQQDELVAAAFGCTIVFGILTDPCIVTVELGIDGYSREQAIGDHDGDGDDEVALGFNTGSVVIIDGE